MPRLKNKRVDRDVEQYLRQQAQESAKVALSEWYARASKNVERLITDVQSDENLALVADILDWQVLKGERNGYVMIVSAANLEPRPIIIKLDYSEATGHPAGGLSYRELHKQLRKALQLEHKYSFRIRKYKPGIGAKDSWSMWLE